jgi:hypothetical protein
MIKGDIKGDFKGGKAVPATSATAEREADSAQEAGSNSKSPFRTRTRNATVGLQDGKKHAKSHPKSPPTRSFTVPRAEEFVFEVHYKRMIIQPPYWRGLDHQKWQKRIFLSSSFSSVSDHSGSSDPSVPMAMVLAGLEPQVSGVKCSD